MLSFPKHREPAANRRGEVVCVEAAEIGGVPTGDFAKYRNIPRQYRQLVACSLDQRQAEAFPFAWGDQASGGCIDRLKILVADALKPKKPFAQFRVMADASRQVVDHPTLLADQNEADIDPCRPQQFECG